MELYARVVQFRYHLLVETPDANLGKGMRRLNGSYAGEPPSPSRREEAWMAGIMMQLAGAAAALLISASAAGAQGEWLSLGSKSWAPTVVSKSGIGTANAVAEAKVTRKEIEGWCANWSPGDKGCVQRELSSPETKKTYRASADCVAGRIIPVDGNTYTLAGKWDNSDIGAGRTRWRNASGKIVGRDNASNGLGISQQWEVLCPGQVKTVRTERAAPAPSAVHKLPAAKFSVGEVVEARYGREWIRGRVNAIRQSSGAQGSQLDYDVRLDNGKRGLLPDRMLRKAGGG